MSAMDRFKKPAGAGAAPAAYQPRHAGVPSNNRDPYPGPGKYVIKILKTEDSSYPKPAAGKNGYFKVTVELLTSNNPDHPVGAKRFISQCVTGKAQETGEGKVKAMITAFCGFKSDAQIDEAMPNFDDKGNPVGSGWAGMWDAASGSPQAEAFHGVQPLIGFMAECVVTQGNPIKNEAGQATGEYHMNYSWAPYESSE